MADEVVTSAPEIAAPTPEPAAAPVAEKRSSKETFKERLERLGWEPTKSATDNPESLGAKSRASESEPAKEETDPADEPTKPDVPKPRPSEPAATDTTADKRAQLATLSAELGMILEDGRVTVAERAALRKERREVQEQIKRMESEAMERIGKSAKAVEDKTPALARLAEFEKLAAEGDHEAVAKFLGHESYDKWQEHIIALKSDPAYRRLRTLEAQVEADRKAKEDAAAASAREAEERTQREQVEQSTRAEREAQNAYMQGLSKAMSTSSDPLLKAMSGDPNFVAAVFRVQKSHWDGTGDPMPIEQALRTPPRGTNAQPLMAELKGLYDKLHPVFGSPAPSAGAVVAAVKAGVGKPAPKVPKTPQPAAPPAPSKSKTDDKAWKDQAAARLAEAVRADMAAERRTASR